MKYTIKFTDNSADTLLLDNIFAVDEYLEYAKKHNMDVIFTETTFTSAIESIYKFYIEGYNISFVEVEQIAPDGLVLKPKIHVVLRRDEECL
ncbi:MAG: hypothetical protein J6R47_01100 [Acholeplasmatales bacterium]|nr:hypothetical protein [Acholeplasmatales bacterium]